MRQYFRTMLDEYGYLKDQFEMKLFPGRYFGESLVSLEDRTQKDAPLRVLRLRFDRTDIFGCYWNIMPRERVPMVKKLTRPKVTFAWAEEHIEPNGCMESATVHHLVDTVDAWGNMITPEEARDALAHPEGMDCSCSHCMSGRDCCGHWFVHPAGDAVLEHGIYRIPQGRSLNV